MRGVSVSEVGWAAALTEAIKRRSENDRLQRDGMVIILSPETKKENEQNEEAT